LTPSYSFFPSVQELPPVSVLSSSISPKFPVSDIQKWNHNDWDETFAQFQEEGRTTEEGESLLAQPQSDYEYEQGPASLSVLLPALHSGQQDPEQP
jgi:hypothetical protein